MVSMYEWINRILTDVFTITVLFSVAVGTFLGFINRKGEETGRSWLYLSLLFLFLGLFVFFDNTLTHYLNHGPVSNLLRIPVIIICLYGVSVFSILSLIEAFGLNRKQSRPLVITILLLISSPVSSFLILKYGLNWYLHILAKPALIVFGLGILLTLGYSGILLFTLKKYRDFRSMITYIGIAGTGMFIYMTKVLQDRDPKLYQTQTYLILVLFLLVFLFLLSRQNQLEYRELKELREARKLISDQSSINSAAFNNLLHHVEPGSLPFPASERECRMIRGLCNGLLYKEIALELDISLSSVKKGIHGIYKKAGVQNCVEMIKLLTSLQ